MRPLNKKFYEAVRVGQRQMPPVLLERQPRYYRALRVIEEMWNSSFGSDIRTLLSHAGIYDWGRTGTESFVDDTSYSKPVFGDKNSTGLITLAITVYNTITWGVVLKFQVLVHLNRDDIMDPDCGDIRIKKVIYDLSGLKEVEVILWEE